MGASETMTLDVAEDLAVSPQLVQSALEDTHHILMQTRRRVLEKGRLDTGDMTSADVTHLLEQGSSGLPALEEAIWAGRLEALVPGLADLMALRRPGLAHRLTVGAHCCYSAALVYEIAAGREGGVAVQRFAAQIDDLRPVALAALVHDIGKETPGPGHAERGTCHGSAHSLRVRSGRLRGVTWPTSSCITCCSPRRPAMQDLDDEDAILRVASRLGDRSLVAPLHVLTAADSIATGPTVWTEWHAALIGKLAARLDSALSDDVDGAGIASTAEDIRAHALRARRATPDPTSSTSSIGRR